MNPKKKILIATIDRAKMLEIKESKTNELRRNGMLIKWSDDFVESPTEIFYFRTIPIAIDFVHFGGYDQVHTAHHIKYLKKLLKMLEGIPAIVIAPLKSELPPERPKVTSSGFQNGNPAPDPVRAPAPAPETKKDIPAILSTGDGPDNIPASGDNPNTIPTTGGGAVISSKNSPENDINNISGPSITNENTTTETPEQGQNSVS